MGKYDYLIGNTPTGTEEKENKYASLIPERKTVPLREPVPPIVQKSIDLFSSLIPKPVKIAASIAKAEVKGAVRGFQETPITPKTARNPNVVGVGGGLPGLINPQDTFGAAREAIDTGARSVNDWVNQALDSHKSLLERGVAAGEAGVQTVNTIFGVVMSPLQALAKQPGIGSAVDVVNKIFGAIGGGASEGGVEALNQSPLSDETKRVLTPLVRDASALAAQLVVGKLVGEAVRPPITKLTERTNEIMIEIGKDPTVKSQLKSSINVPVSESAIKPIESPVAVAPESVKVPATQLPVGRGETKASRLEARVTDNLGNLSPDVIEQIGLATYQAMTKAEQIKSATEYVTRSPESAMRVLTGEINPPSGLLRNSIYVALENLASEQATMGRRLASLMSTRLGQELSILTEVNPLSPVRAMKDITKIRVEALKGKAVNMGREVQRISEEIRSEVKKSRSQRPTWEEFVKSIEC